MTRKAFRTRRLSAIAVVAVALAMVVTGCGKNSSDSDSGSSQTTGAIASLDGVLALYMPYLLTTDVAATSADPKLTFKGVGASSANAVSAVLSGDVDFAALATATTIEYASKQSNIRIVGSVIDTSGGVILRDEVIKKKGLSLDDSVETRVKSLKGMTIATGPEGGAAIIDLRRMLEKFGMDPQRDVKIVPIADVAALVAGMREGKFDGTYYNLASVLNLVADGIGQVYVSRSSGDLDGVLEPGVGAVVITLAKTVKEKPELVQGVYERMGNLLTKVHKDPAEVGELLRKDYVAGLDPKSFDLSWDEVVRTSPTDARFTKADFDIAVAAATNDASRIKYDELVYKPAQG